MAELMVTSERRGEGCGCGNGERWRRALLGCRGRETGEGMSMEGGVRGPGVARGVVQRGRGGQPSRRWPSAWARAAATRPRAHWHEEEDDRREAGLGQPAGPPAGPPERPGNSLSLSLYFLF